MDDSRIYGAGWQEALSPLSLEIRFVMERVKLLTDQIPQLDEQLQDHMTEQQSFLRSVPDLGPVWTPTILAEILPVFHPGDQHGAREFVAAAGLDVKQFDSGDLVGHGRMIAASTISSLSCRQQDAPRHLQCPQEQPSIHTYPQLNRNSISAHDWC